MTVNWRFVDLSSNSYVLCASLADAYVFPLGIKEVWGYSKFESLYSHVYPSPKMRMCSKAVSSRRNPSPTSLSGSQKTTLNSRTDLTRGKADSQFSGCSHCLLFFWACQGTKSLRNPKTEQQDSRSVKEMRTCLHAIKVTVEDFVVMPRGDASHNDMPAYLLTQKVTNCGALELHFWPVFLHGFLSKLFVSAKQGQESVFSCNVFSDTLIPKNFNCQPNKLRKWTFLLCEPHSSCITVCRFMLMSCRASLKSTVFHTFFSEENAFSFF